MKVRDIIFKQDEFRQIEKARKELELFKEDLCALYGKSKALINNDTTSFLIEHDFFEGIRICQDKLTEQLVEMEV